MDSLSTEQTSHKPTSIMDKLPAYNSDVDFLSMLVATKIKFHINSGDNLYTLKEFGLGDYGEVVSVTCQHCIDHQYQPTFDYVATELAFPCD